MCSNQDSRLFFYYIRKEDKIKVANDSNKKIRINNKTRSPTNDTQEHRESDDIINNNEKNALVISLLLLVYFYFNLQLTAAVNIIIGVVGQCPALSTHTAVIFLTYNGRGRQEKAVHTQKI